MDGFLGYNHTAIKLTNQHKTAFVCPWGKFAYRKLPFGLKNARETLQWDMDYTFTISDTFLKLMRTTFQPIPRSEPNT